MIQFHLWEGFSVEGHGDPSICEERTDPVAQGLRKAQEGEDVDEAIDMEVVKRTPYVEEDKSGNVT